MIAAAAAAGGRDRGTHRPPGCASPTPGVRRPDFVRGDLSLDDFSCVVLFFPPKWLVGCLKFLHGLEMSLVRNITVERWHLYADVFCQTEVFRLLGVTCVWTRVSLVGKAPLTSAGAVLFCETAWSLSLEPFIQLKMIYCCLWLWDKNGFKIFISRG